MNKHTIFNYFFNLSILIAGIILLITKISIFLGIAWICIGSVMILLVRLTEIHFKKEKKRIDELFKKLTKV